jgi:hypothetical protein
MHQFKKTTSHPVTGPRTLVRHPYSGVLIELGHRSSINNLFKVPTIILRPLQEIWRLTLYKDHRVTPLCTSPVGIEATVIQNQLYNNLNINFKIKPTISLTSVSISAS